MEEWVLSGRWVLFALAVAAGLITVSIITLLLWMKTRELKWFLLAFLCAITPSVTGAIVSLLWTGKEDWWWQTTALGPLRFGMTMSAAAVTGSIIVILVKYASSRIG